MIALIRTMYVADIPVKPSPIKSCAYHAGDENANPLLGAFFAILIIAFVFLLIATAVYFIRGLFLFLV